MLISIITPSFRNSEWLKLCIASVADQENVHLEHIVQDAGSDDGTLEWLPKDPRVKCFVERDGGMYDAVNRGLRKSKGDILAYLNCDEQYLPGALASVKDFFEKNPRIEVLFGDVLIVNPAGECLCYRKSILPQEPHSMVSNNLSVITCATFFRRSVIEKRGLFFNTAWRDLGDANWVLSCLRQGVPMALLKRYTSVFTDTGENMNLKPNARREVKQLFDSAPRWAQRCNKLIVAHHRVRKLMGGAYRQKPFDYSIYTRSNSQQRSQFQVRKPTFVWEARMASPK